MKKAASSLDAVNMPKQVDVRPSESVIQEVLDALVIPHIGDLPARGEERRQSTYNGGVYDADRALVPLAIHYAEGSRNVPDPKPPIATGMRMAGTFLFGGWLRRPFGHFLLESTARLWPLPCVADSIAGIV